MSKNISELFSGPIPPGFDANAALQLAQEKARTPWQQGFADMVSQNGKKTEKSL